MKSPTRWLRPKPLLAVAALLAAAVSGARAQTLVLNPVADTYVYFGINQTTNFGTLGYTYLFANTTIRETFGYYRFDLSSLPGDAVITGATLTFFKAVPGAGERSDGMTTGRFGVFGLNDVAGNTAQNWGETTLTFNNRGSEWISNNTFDLTRVTTLDEAAGNEIVTATSASVSGAGLVGFLSSRQAGGGLVTFIADQTGLDAGRGFVLGTRENIDTTLIPTLSLTFTSAIPEPSTYALLLGAATFGVVIWRRRTTKRS